jgi:hypothetical protein
MSQVRFYLDEHVASAVAAALRRRNIEVVTVVDAKLRTADDDTHLAYAHREGLVMFTQDEDLLALAAGGHAHCGIVYAPQGTHIGAIVDGLVLVWHVCTAEEMIGHIEFL